MKGYIAGPMSGIRQFNFPAFDAAAEKLRAVGFEVVSPAELDDPEHRALALASETGDPAEIDAKVGVTWGDFLARDVKLIADSGVQAIFVLPGWETSRGAMLETFVGVLAKLPIIAADTLWLISPEALLSAWSKLLLRKRPIV